MEKTAAPQAHPAGEHFRGRHDSVTLRPLRLGVSALKIPVPLLGLLSIDLRGSSRSREAGDLMGGMNRGGGAAEKQEGPAGLAGPCKRLAC